MNAVGTASLVRLILRRDRIRIALWTVGIVGLVAATVESIVGLYPEPEDLERYARTVRGNSALIVQAGPGYGLQDPDVAPTTGAVIMNELSVWVLIALAVMAIFMVVRHTRTEEETGRAETIRSLPVGRDAPLVATLLALGMVAALISAGSGITLLAYGLPLTGTIAFAGALLAATVLFGMVATVTAQVASGSRAALGLAGAVLAAAYVLRAIGDVRGDLLTWLSPLGWGQGVRAYADERWWPLLLSAVAIALLLAVTVQLQSGRDLGAGLLPDRAGPATAAESLDSPLALSVRLQRASVFWWTVGLAVLGFFYGLVADQAESILDENPEMEDFFAQLGQGTITEAFVSAMVLIVALTATGFTVSSVLRLRGEESSGRAELVLATATPRVRLGAGPVLVAVVGTVVVMSVAGLAMGLGMFAASGDAGWIGRVLVASLVMVPACWVVGAVALLAHGLSARWSLVAWGAFAYVLLVGVFATVLDLPQVARDLSPFEHVPALPAAEMSWPPVLVLVAVALALTAAGLTALSHRDIG